MPRRRRQPPTPLILWRYTPPRGEPRHFLPRRPSPVFHAHNLSLPSMELQDQLELIEAPNAAIPRARDRDWQDLPPLIFSPRPTHRRSGISFSSQGINSGSVSISQSRCTDHSIIRKRSASDASSDGEDSKEHICLGPWDHSGAIGSIALDVDVHDLLPPPAEMGGSHYRIRAPFKEYRGRAFAT